MSEANNVWVHKGFDAFSEGRFDDGGSNLYVNAKGIIERIHRTDVNNNGYVDIVLPNSHGYVERGPTTIYKVDKGEGKDWPQQVLPNDSGWMSRVADVDGDGYPDLIVVNGENGVTSELSSYVYWGGPKGLTGERVEFPTVGAYDVAAVDLKGEGRLDLIFPSAWADHHNAGELRDIHVYRQTKPREFENATAHFGLKGMAAVSVASADLNGNGKLDLVVANYRDEYIHDTDSYIYWGTDDGFDTENPFRLPTHFALRVLLADLNEDGHDEVIFCGGNEVKIFWNEQGKFDPENYTTIEEQGFSTMFCQGALNVAFADVDRDGKIELLLVTEEGVQIRKTDDLQTIQSKLPVPYATWVFAEDLDGNGHPDLIVSKYDNRVTYETESVIFWNGPDGFSPERITELPTAGAMGCTAGDLDGDGRPEVIFNSTMGGPSQFYDEFPAYVYFGNEKAEYSVEQRLDLPVGGGYAYIMADLDLDGYPELVFTSRLGLRVFSGGPDGPRANNYYDLETIFKGNLEVHVADLNRDGYLDLLVMALTYDDRPETMAASSTIFYGSKDGFSTERSENFPTYCYGTARLADVNHDGYLDIIVVDKHEWLKIYLGGPDGYSPERTWDVELPAPRGVMLNVGDINKNGYLDIVVAMMGHYIRRPETLCILYGGPDGYSLDNSQQMAAGYSAHCVALADLNNDGNLDLYVPAYSSTTTRELPAQIFWGNGKTIDLENPLNLPAEAPTAALMIDINRNGYNDLVITCHRNNLGHQVDSLIYWNSPDGFSTDRVTRFPGMGPHETSTRDHGNAYNREPYESYISPSFELNKQTPLRIYWEAEIVPTTAIKFQLRWGKDEQELENAEWQGPEGNGSYYETSGADIQGVPSQAQWLQYRAELISLYGCGSPQLSEVRIEFEA